LAKTKQLGGAMSFFEILKNPKITEIILHPDDELNYEIDGKLITADASLWKEIDSSVKDKVISKITEVLPQAPNYENPLCSGIWNGFRVQVIAPPIIEKNLLVQLRRLSLTRDFKSFRCEDWQGSIDLTNLLEKKIKDEKANFIIAGPTGCGKTTLLKSLLSSFCKEDRVLCLEDTPELPRINTNSNNLKTYNATSEELKDITLDDLVKASLRLRPDRLMMGEMRGEEASSFLLMLSTGHRGSGATLHAHNPQDALRRLEMLVQMGSPWNLQTVRQLIYSSLDIVITMGRDEKGQRAILKVSELESLEEHGFLVHHLYEKSELAKSNQDFQISEIKKRGFAFYN
jgi:pilus assembly protein CpaF